MAEPEATIHLQNYRLFWRILIKLDLATAEAYVDGSLTIANALWEMQPDISVTGITLSENQHAYATQRAKQDQRQQHLAFHLCDYRRQRGSFERIVPISMLEHVGVRHFDSYFASIAWLLAPNGVALVHSIWVHQNTKRCNRWLNRYIFPGG